MNLEDVQILAVSVAFGCTYGGLLFIWSEYYTRKVIEKIRSDRNAGV